MSEPPTDGTPPEPTPEEQRAPRRVLSDEEKMIVRETLKRPDVKYNISLTAKLLGLNYGQVEAFVRTDPWLAAQCPNKDASKMVPEEPDIIDRMALPDPSLVALTKAEYETYQAFIRQNRKMLSKDWQALGIDADTASKMESYTQLGGAPIGQVIRLGHGQLIKNMMRLDNVIEMDAKMILSGEIPEELKADGTPKDPEKVEREWRHTLYAGMKLQLDMFTATNRTQALMARAARDMKAALERGQKPGKAGLAPSATQVVQREAIDGAAD